MIKKLDVYFERYIQENCLEIDNISFFFWQENGEAENLMEV